MLRKQQSVILPFLDQQYSLIRPQLLQSSTQFEELLETLFANLNHIYLVIDGLDEIDPNERKKLMSSLMALHGKSENLRVFFSSRKEIDIADTLSIYPSLQVSNGNDGDISKYVDYHGEEVFGRFVPLAPETENTIRKIIEEVKERAKGTSMRNLASCNVHS